MAEWQEIAAEAVDPGAFMHPHEGFPGERQDIARAIVEHVAAALNAASYRVVNQQECVNSAAQEVEWAHKILDMFGIPRTIHNPYEGTDDPLNTPGRISVALNPHNLPDTAGKRPHVLQEGEVPPWMEQVPNLWVYTGEDVYVEGTPFGGWQRHGEGYRCDAWPDQSDPVYRVVPKEDPDE